MGARTGRPPTGEARDAIIAAAIACFRAGGYEATSVQQVVERAKVTKGAFYHHFSSKQDLLALIHDTFMTQQLRTIEQIAHGPGGARDKLGRLVEEMIVDAERFQEEYTIFLEQRRFLSEDQFAEVRRKRDEFEQYVVDILDDGVAAGEFVEVGTTRVIAFGLIGMVAWSLQWFRDGEMSARDVGSSYARLLLEGLVPR